MHGGHIGSFTLAANHDAYDASNIEVSGDTGNRRIEGGAFRATGTTAVIADGAIQSWAFGSGWNPCT